MTTYEMNYENKENKTNISLENYEIQKFKYIKWIRFKLCGEKLVAFVFEHMSVVCQFIQILHSGQQQQKRRSVVLSQTIKF